MLHVFFIIHITLKSIPIGVLWQIDILSLKYINIPFCIEFHNILNVLFLVQKLLRKICVLSHASITQMLKGITGDLFGFIIDYSDLAFQIDNEIFLKLRIIQILKS